MTVRHSQVDEDYWPMTALHECAHGIVAFGLDCHPIELSLNRRLRPNDMAAGVCKAQYEQTCYGLFAKIFVKNAPFCASQYECLPCADSVGGDINERYEAYGEFCKLTGHQDQRLFYDHVDKPLIAFFGHGIVQASVLTLANKLYTTNKVSLKRFVYWREQLAIPPVYYESLQADVMRLAQALADSQ
jgi:hypothetical protein